MKRIISIVIVLAVIIALSTYLFVSGQEHKIIIENPIAENVELPKEMTLTFDDMKKPIRIRLDKKALVEVKGTNHTLKIAYKLNNQDKVIDTQFETPINMEFTMNMTKFLLGEKEWIISKKIERILPAVVPVDPKEGTISTDAPVI